MQSDPKSPKRSAKPYWWIFAAICIVISIVVVRFGARLHRRSVLEAEVARCGASVDMRTVGPEWMRRFLGVRAAGLLDEICGLKIVIEPERPKFSFQCLKGQTGLEWLRIDYRGSTEDDDDDAAKQFPAENPDSLDDALVNTEGLFNLQSLELEGTRISGKGLRHIAGLTNLISLDLTDTQVDDTGLEALEGLHKLELLSLCRHLSLDRASLTDAGLRHLRGLTNLRELRLDGTAITDAGLECLSGMSQLRILSIRDTAITDAAASRLLALPRLEKLFIGGSDIHDSGVSKLFQERPGLEIEL